MHPMIGMHLMHAAHLCVPRCASHGTACSVQLVLICRKSGCVMEVLQALPSVKPSLDKPCIVQVMHMHSASDHVKGMSATSEQHLLTHALASLA